jgi:hypothetical protein
MHYPMFGLGMDIHWPNWCLFINLIFKLLDGWIMNIWKNNEHPIYGWNIFPHMYEITKIKIKKDKQVLIRPKPCLIVNFF